MPKNDGIRIPSGYAVTILSVLLSGAIGFNAWAVAAVYDRPTTETVTTMIADKSEAPVIYEMLKGIREDIAELKQMLKGE
jgi:hypothetical protein